MQAVNPDSKAKVQKFKPMITPPRRRAVTSMGEDHLEIGVNQHRTQETTDEIKTMGHTGLGVRIFQIGVTKDMA